MINPPWYFECGWWSPWCFIDEWAHRIANRFRPVDGCGYLPWPLTGVCRRHDAAVVRHYERLEAGGHR